MVLRDLVASITRRWYVPLAALVVAFAAFIAMEQSGGVYVTKPVISFLLPGGEMISQDNGVELGTVILFATTVAEAVNNGRPVDRYAAEDAPAYGAGETQSVRIAVPNVGGQWSTSYVRAEIAISIVGPTEEWVRSTQEALIDRVLTVAEEQQTTFDVAESARFESSIVPLSTAIEHVGSGITQRALAGAALGGAALIVGGTIAGGLDRVMRNRESPRAKRRHSPSSNEHSLARSDAA